MTTIELNAEIYRQIGYLSDDRSYLEKALELLQGLTRIKSVAKARSRKYTELLESLSDFQSYEQGWDGENALPLDKNVVINFKSILQECDDSYLKGWVISPEKNGTLFMCNDQCNAGINIGIRDYSYYMNKGGKVVGENSKEFTPASVIDTMKQICA